MRRWGPRLTIVALVAVVAGLLPALAFVLRDPPPQHAWKVLLGLPSRPVHAGRVVAVVDMENEVLGVDARSGARRWLWRPGVSATGALAYDDASLYVGLRTGLCAVRPDSGAPRWCVQRPEVTRISAGAGVVLVLEAGRVVALAPSDGTELWARDTPDVGSSAEVSAAGDALYLSGESGLVSLEASTGATRWRVGGDYRFRTHVFGDTLYAIRHHPTSDHLEARFTADGAARYISPLRGRSAGGPARVASLVIVAGRSRSSDWLEAFGTRTGRRRWRRALDHRASPPVAVDGLIALEQGGRLELRNSERGEVWGGRSAGTRPGDRPVRSGDLLILRSDNHLEAVRI